MDSAVGIHVRPAWKDIAYGSVAGMIAKVFEHPFDLIKVRLQSQPLDRPPRYGGPIDCFKQTFSSEGVRGLYRGLSMPIMGAMAENATLFVVYSQTQALLRHYAMPAHIQHGLDPLKPLPLSYVALAGGCAGAVTSFVLTPIELIKVRMQVQMISQEKINSGQNSVSHARPVLPGPVALYQSVLKQRGVTGLWLGQTGTFIREAGGSVAWFAAFEGMARLFVRQRQIQSKAGRTLTKDDLGSLELMAAGAAAGIGYTVTLFPADCIKSTIQTGDELARYRTGGGFFRIGRDIYRARGIRGLYSGCGVTVIRSAPSSAIIFWIYSLLERKFG